MLANQIARALAYRVVVLLAALSVLLPLALMWPVDTGVAHSASPTSPRRLAAVSCAPDVRCTVLGEPSRDFVTTINNGGLACTITWTVNWGDGSPHDTVTASSNSIVNFSHTYQARGTYIATLEPSIDPASSSGCFSVPGGWRYQRVWQVVDPLTATVAPVSSVLRGRHALLNASASLGPNPITTYRWDFTPEGDCPPGLTLADQTVTSEDATLDIQVLCDLLVRLTVTDTSGDTAQQTAHVPVDARTTGQWKPTTVDLVPRGSSADSRTPRRDFVLGRDTVFGITVTRCRRDTRPESLCPPTDGLDSLEGKAFGATDINDPGGPFHGFWFMLANHVSVKLTGLFNPNMFKSSGITHPDAAHPKRKKFNWFRYNQRHKRPVNDVIRAVRMHEGWGKNGTAARPNDSGHAGAQACYLRNNKTRHNPAVVLEALFDQDKADVVSHANDSLRRINNELRAADADPLPVIWRGKSFFWDRQTHSWKLGSYTIGGARRPPRC